MRLKKKNLIEIIDSNGDLIGVDDVPTSGADLETRASNTTDYNLKVGQQPFRYDMLGRFGFTLMPFMEGEEDTNDDIDINFNELINVVQETYLLTLEHYYKNPNKLKSDFRKISDGSENKLKIDLVDKFLNLIKQFKGKKTENIGESRVAEDKMVNKKSEDEITDRTKDKGIKEKKIEKIAGLINKLELDKKDIDKLINLLEIKNG